MNLGQFYDLIVKLGVKHDPRKENAVQKYLKSVRKEYDNLPRPEKELFDKEKLTNPFSDTRILYGSPKAKVKTVMVGVDIETPELLLADRLRSKGKHIDLAMSHHPQGRARAEFYRVMNVLQDILKDAGVSGSKITKMLDDRMDEVLRKTVAGNCTRPVDAARYLNIPFMCAHTVTDNFAYEYFFNLLKNKKPSRVSNILDLLYEIPEYRASMKNNQGPKIILGNKHKKCGKVLIEMTGGTEGPKGMYASLAKKKITTIIGMHMSEGHFKKAKKYKMNVIIAGHMSSDSLGINLLLDEIEKCQKLNIIPCSGFTRISRTSLRGTQNQNKFGSG